MSVTQDEVRAFTGQRVRVKFGGEEKFLRMIALTPNDTVILADARGHELLLPLDDLKTIEDARIKCRECGALVNVIHGGDAQRCADCERAFAATQPVPNEQCEEEGCDKRAFYSPAAKKFRCAQHHAKYNTLSGAFAESRVMQQEASECKGTDTADPRHRWFHIKGHRWHCKNCPARRYDDPPLGTIYREPR